MRCDVCGNEMIISQGEPRTELGTLAIYRDFYMVCPNQKCDNFSGVETNESKRKFLKTIPINAAAREEVRANGGTT